VAAPPAPSPRLPPARWSQGAPAPLDRRGAPAGGRNHPAAGRARARCAPRGLLRLRGRRDTGTRGVDGSARARPGGTLPARRAARRRRAAGRDARADAADLPGRESPGRASPRSRGLRRGAGARAGNPGRDRAGARGPPRSGSRCGWTGRGSAPHPADRSRRRAPGGLRRRLGLGAQPAGAALFLRVQPGRLPALGGWGGRVGPAVRHLRRGGGHPLCPPRLQRCLRQPCARSPLGEAHRPQPPPLREPDPRERRPDGRPPRGPGFQLLPRPLQHRLLALGASGVPGRMARQLRARRRGVGALPLRGGRGGGQVPGAGRADAPRRLRRRAGGGEPAALRTPRRRLPVPRALRHALGTGAQESRGRDRGLPAGLPRR
jgi:hypothetical protein